MRRLPPLSAVRVFETAARHENFTVAAAELGMTQAAVSHQIRVLEDRLGQRLFRRERQRVMLTDPGRRAALRAGRGLDEIEAAFAELRAEDDTALTISTTVTFANTWLAWRLGRFQVSHPDVAVRLITDNNLTDFGAEGVDVAIRLGEGEWPGLASHRLVDVDFTPMCSPGFLADHGAIAPTDLARLPLISPGEPMWAEWLHGAGLSPATVSGVQLDTQANEGHAAMAGQGIALLTPFLWRHDMADGRLVRLSERTSTLGQAFWLVYPEHRRRSAKIRRFREWLEAEVALAQAGPSAG